MSSDDTVKSLWHTSAHLRTAEEADIREVIEDAADKIERLQAEVERKHDYACRMDALAEERLMEITRLRAAGDALASFVGVWFEAHYTDEPSYLVAAWREARRER